MKGKMTRTSQDAGGSSTQAGGIATDFGSNTANQEALGERGGDEFSWEDAGEEEFEAVVAGDSERVQAALEQARSPASEGGEVITPREQESIDSVGD